MHRPKIKVGSKHFHLPQSKTLRVGVGVLFLAGGALWFLPVLGLWMIPVGVIILSHDIPLARRWRRRVQVRLQKRSKGQRDRNRAKESRFEDELRKSDAK